MIGVDIARGWGAVVQQGACRTVVEPDVEELLADGAHALSADGDLLASRTRFERAYREAERAGNTTAIAEAALGLCGMWVHERRTAAASTQVRERLRHALSLVDPKSPVALRLRIRLAAEADYHTGEYAAILAALDEARQAGDPVALADALSLAHHCLLGPGHGPLRRKLADELIGASFRTMRRADLLMGLLWQTVDLFLDADPLAGRRLGELREMLARQGHLAVGFVVSALDVLLAVRAGRLDDAEALVAVCAARGAAAGDVDATGWSGGQLFAIRWYQGRVAELLPMFDELAQSPTLSVVDNSFFVALAVAAAASGDRRTAAGVLATLCGRDLADLPRSSTWLVTMTGIVEAAHLLGDPDTAARAYELLRPFAHLPVIASLGVACFGSVHHALGVASLTTGDPDRAVGHFREAVKANSAIAHWPAVVSSRVRYAQALALRARPSDAAIVRRELAVAADEAAALDLPLPDYHIPQPPPLAAVCLRQGRRWRITWGRHSVLVDHGVGMHHLAVLIASPHAEFDAVDLVAGSATEQPTPDGYRRRLAELRAEIDELEAKDDRVRADGARAERDWLIAEVVGTSRFLDSGDERTVGRAIRRAIGRVATADAVIGNHLADAVHTGLRCCYRPA